MTDADILDLIRKEVKRRQEALEMMRNAGRLDLVAEETTELEILEAYLPAQMSEAEVRVLAQQVAEEIGASSLKDMGRVMGALMPRIQGRADGRMVNQVVRGLFPA